jgi:putative spermidine/putrescine transport system permease protein
LLVSLKLAVATAALALPIGLAAAYAIHASSDRFFRRLHTILLMPLMVPHIIIAVGIFYMYARIGWLGSFVGLVFAHAMLAVPFVVVTALAGLRDFDVTQEQVARSLGCTRLQAFLRVTLPQLKGSVLSGLLFAFVTSLDEVVVALFVASGANTTVTKVMFSSLRDEIDPTIAAVSSLLILGSFLVAGAGMFSAGASTPRRADQPR